MKKEITLTDFMSKEIIRKGDSAEIIFEHVNNKPVRLIGFKVDASKSDFEIRELGFLYFLELIEQSKHIKT